MRFGRFALLRSGHMRGIGHRRTTEIATTKQLASDRLHLAIPCEKTAHSFPSRSAHTTEKIAIMGQTEERMTKCLQIIFLHENAANAISHNFGNSSRSETDNR